MSGETDIDLLFRHLSARLDKEVYVFATFPDRTLPPGIETRMRFEEAEGTTAILTRGEANRHGVNGAFPCRMITLEVHSSLAAVGFIARIATALAAENMGVNPVAGFFHDHLFVPLGREQDALRIIESLAREARDTGA